METEFAPAKINLTLHVTGRRGDGYHLLDSLVVFAGIGDRIAAKPDRALSLSLTGPMAEGLRAEPDNLVLRAARLMLEDAGAAEVRLTLEKHLPVSSGIGGGSADAAATLRLLSRIFGRSLPPASEVLRLGADVPVCLAGRAVRMSGVGEVLTPVGPLPDGWLVLANPRKAVSTPEVFRALTRRDHAPMPAALPALTDMGALSAFLVAQRNDLEPPAMQLVPEVAAVKAALGGQTGCLLARMSGSGATCFGLFAEERAARAAEAALRSGHPGWWVAAGRMLT